MFWLNIRFCLEISGMLSGPSLFLQVQNVVNSTVSLILFGVPCWCQEILLSCLVAPSQFIIGQIFVWLVFISDLHATQLANQESRQMSARIPGFCGLLEPWNMFMNRNWKDQHFAFGEFFLFISMFQSTLQHAKLIPTAKLSFAIEDFDDSVSPSTTAACGNSYFGSQLSTFFGWVCRHVVAGGDCHFFLLGLSTAKEESLCSLWQCAGWRHGLPSTSAKCDFLQPCISPATIFRNALVGFEGVESVSAHNP